MSFEAAFLGISESSLAGIGPRLTLRGLVVHAIALAFHSLVESCLLLVGRGSTLSITHIFAIDCSRGFDESRGDGKALRAWGPLLKPSRERKRATSSAWRFGAMNTRFSSLRKRNISHRPRTWCSRPPLFPLEWVADISY